MSKYEPLQQFLLERSEGQIPLSFEEIEAILGFELPDSARRYAPWWSNVGGTHVQASAWLAAGWRTSNVDVPGGRVVFVRDRNMRSPTSPGSGPNKGAGDAVELRNLSVAAAKLLADYTSEAAGDRSAAVARALHEAAIARRARHIDRAIANAPHVDIDSTDLIREDRDAR
jgi:hypothetical protein